MTISNSLIHWAAYGLSFFFIRLCYYLCGMEEASYKEVNEFIRRELDKHGEWLVDTFVEQLEKNGNVITGQLLDSLNWTLYDPGDGSAAGLEVGFETYGRFFEIRSRESRIRKKNAMPLNTNKIVWGMKENKPRKKRTRWYAKNMYGGLGKLVSRLSAGISDDELARIRRVMADTTVNHMKLFWDEKI